MNNLAVPASDRAVQTGAGSARVVPCPAEAELQRFCEATLELLCAGPSQGSVLSEVLPSLTVALATASHGRIPQLWAELRAWESSSTRLTRLAVSHCGPEAQSLLQKIDQARQAASSVIESLESLAAFINGTVPHATTADQTNSADDGVRRFCQSVLVLLRSGPANSSVIAKLLPSLVEVLGQCGRQTLSELWAEMRAWDSASEELAELAVSHCGAGAEGLLIKLERARLQAGRVLDALERLQLELPTTAGDDLADNDSGAASAGASELQLAQIESCLQSAEKYQQTQNYVAAEECYSRALRHDRKLRLAWTNRGQLRLLRAKFPQAIDDLSEAIRLDPTDPLSLGFRGDAYTLSERFAEAISDYTQALVLSPGLLKIRYNRAVALRMNGSLDSSLQELNELIEVKPDHGPFYLNRGLIWLTRGDLVRACAEFRTALVHQPNSLEAQRRLTEVESRLKVSSAIESLEPAAVPEVALAAVQAGAERSQSAQVPTRVKSAMKEEKLPPPEPADDDLALMLLDLPDIGLMDEPRRVTNASDDTKVNGRETVADIPFLDSDASDVDLLEMSADSESSSDSASSSASEASDTGLARSNTASKHSSSSHSFEYHFECPICERPSTVAWEKLQRGKVLGCPHCRRNFTAGGGGELLEVRKDAQGKWKEVPSVRKVSRTKIVAGSVLTGLVILGLLLVPVLNRRSAYADVELPDELEPRAKVFAVAWLKSDYRVMRRLTDPDQSVTLFSWYRKNQSPKLVSSTSIERDVKVDVAIVSQNEPTTRLTVRMDGLKTSDGNPRHELKMAWEKKHGVWRFLPATKSKT